KAAALLEAKAHLDRAHMQREEYNKWRSSCKDHEMIEFDGSDRLTFASPRACNIFGIKDERTNNIQINYLIDEADSIGKGPNATVSLLQDYFDSRPPKDVLVLWADNCVGQNKNNAMVPLLSKNMLARSPSVWRIQTNTLEVVEAFVIEDVVPTPLNESKKDDVAPRPEVPKVAVADEPKIPDTSQPQPECGIVEVTEVLKQKRRSIKTKTSRKTT
ncbi:hypothetical protein U1Q18_050515, partial [Sarracenia purpurea var. burkii]